MAAGNATLHIINIVDGYPAEDREVRGLVQQIRHGGNAAYTLVARASWFPDQPPQIWLEIPA